MVETERGAALEAIRRHQRHNFWVNVLDLTFYDLALSFIFGSTVLSLYTSYLTSSAFLIGLVPAIQNAGYFVPQLLLAQRAETLPRKKPFIMRISVMERLPYFVVAGLILLWPEAPSWLAYLVLLLSLGTATFSGGLAGPAWQAMIAKVVPASRRGLLFSLGRAFGGGLGLLGALLSRRILADYAYPISFGLCFLLAFAAQACSWCCLAMNREPSMPVTREAVAPRAYLGRLPTLLRHDRNLRRYLVARILTVLGGMTGAFYVIYARRAFGVGDAFAGELTMAALAAQVTLVPFLGWLSGRLGHKWLAELGSLLGAVGLLALLLAPSAPWLYLVFAIINTGNAAVGTASFAMTMEFCLEEEVPTYTAMINTILAAPILLAPMLGGWLVDAVGFRVAFGLALAFCVLGWGTMRWLVRDPRIEAP
ncbi:MAG: MFS transporter, partial [Anaerolineae bacterium]